MRLSRLRYVWWRREDEVPFPEWKTARVK